MKPPLIIRLSARAVVASGVAFRDDATTYADADVARDEIRALPPPPEPLVLRVWARGGTDRERARVEGDWLCDPKRKEPRRIPIARWDHSPAAVAWSDGRPWLEAWEGCEDARWMVHAATAAGLPRKAIARAHCPCLREVMPLVPQDETRPLQAIETVEAWALGEATSRDLDDAYRAVSACADALATAAISGPSFAAVESVVSLLFNVRRGPFTARDDAPYAAAVLDQAAYAMRDLEVSNREALRRFADLVRLHLPTLDVLRAAVDDSIRSRRRR